MALRWKAFAPNTILKAVEIQDIADNGVVQLDTAADLADADLVNANMVYVTGENKPYVRNAAGVGADKWEISNAQHGLTHINTTTFSAVSSVSLDNVFTRDYENYRIILSFSAGSANMTMRLRASGTDSSASYILRGFNVSDTSNSNAIANDAAQWDLATLSDASCVTFDLLKPQIVEKTTLTGFSVGSFSLASTSGHYFVGAHYVDGSYDGLTFFGTSITGTIRVYGYKNGA